MAVNYDIVFSVNRYIIPFFCPQDLYCASVLVKRGCDSVKLIRKNSCIFAPEMGIIARNRSKSSD